MPNLLRIFQKVKVLSKEDIFVQLVLMKKVFLMD